ncbi:Gamma-glutamylputrescine oxidoreductase [Raoultella planticola]|uniref:Gamma-glutamylputrescine oxidoreductase n=2 Tax=Klebsiella/Raoultella group TaxID=2890311 RepID=A0A485A6S3_RAOPL|nr:Gamma-glutamylputrescine oxidoreductase [Raoultella planticola]
MAPAGRNGGQLVNSYSRDIDVIEKTYGPDAARMLGSMMFEGGEIIRERIQRYQIQCDYRPGGLFVAMNHKQLETLEEQKANWERYGNNQLELLDANAIRREVNSDRYTGALLDHSGGHIHPLNLAIGEADAIRLNGGRIYEQSPVTRIQHTSPAVVSTAKGQVTARYVIVAGNAYLGDKVEPELAKRSMPCGTQVVTTEPLSEEVARSLIPKNYCVEDCNYLLDYYRLTGDNRLLYGGGVVYGARDPDDVERLIMPKLLKTFPQLKGVKIDYRWTGNFLLTLSRMPQFGRLDNNIYYMQGYSGHGVTCTHLAGRLISELLRGDAERFDAFANLPHYPFPGGRSLRIPFTAMGAAYLQPARPPRGVSRYAAWGSITAAGFVDPAPGAPATAPGHRYWRRLFDARPAAYRRPHARQHPPPGVFSSYASGFAAHDALLWIVLLKVVA